MASLCLPPRFPSTFGHATAFARTSRQLQCTRQVHVRVTTTAARYHDHERLRKRQPNHFRPAPSTFRTYSEPPSQPRPSLSEARRCAREAYRPPTSGLISMLPSLSVPYAELIRLDKPAGTYYLFFPCLFSTLLAAPLTTPITSISTVLSTSVLFFAGALVMRGAGCTINDLWDRDLDPYVTRTRIRPIARGAITVQQAIPFLGFQLFTGLGILLQFPTQCLYYAVPSLILVAAYPLAKRVTNYPQVVLGMTFSWGAIMGFPALGISLVSDIPAFYAAVSLYVACIAWTVIYDMIYAFQDIRDDAAAGIKSIALAQEGNARMFLFGVMGLQLGALGLAGAAVGTGPVFILGACMHAVVVGQMIARVNLKSVDDCWWWFKNGAWITGGALSLGLAGEYLACQTEWYTPKRESQRLQK